LTNSDCDQEYDPDFSPLGDAIAYSCAGHIYLWTKNASEARLLISSDGKDAFPRFSPNGRRVYFARYGYYGSYSPIAQPHAHEWNLYVIELADKTIHALTNENFYGIGELSISPDGKEMLVSTLDKGILVYSTNGGADLQSAGQVELFLAKSRVDRQWSIHAGRQLNTFQLSSRGNGWV
jgi:dipeptidyl aminopeptidase/acylaminoacyl peptidase